MTKRGNVSFVTRVELGPACNPPLNACSSCTAKGNETGQVEQINYLDRDDPVSFGVLHDVYGSAEDGGSVVISNGEWLYSSGKQKSVLWNPCPSSRLVTATHPDSKPADDTVFALNIYDPRSVVP